MPVSARLAFAEVVRFCVLIPKPVASAAVVNAKQTKLELTDVEVCVLPTKTERAFRLTLPVSRPAAVAVRVISLKTDWNSLSSVARDPENVPDADCADRVSARSSSREILLRAPSSI